jgi:hypothetical protein
MVMTGLSFQLAATKQSPTGAANIELRLSKELKNARTPHSCFAK